MLTIFTREREMKIAASFIVEDIYGAVAMVHNLMRFASAVGKIMLGIYL